MARIEVKSSFILATQEFHLHVYSVYKWFPWWCLPSSPYTVVSFVSRFILLIRMNIIVYLKNGRRTQQKVKWIYFIFFYNKILQYFPFFSLSLCLSVHCVWPIFCLPNGVKGILFNGIGWSKEKKIEILNEITFAYWAIDARRLNYFLSIQHMKNSNGIERKKTPEFRERIEEFQISQRSWSINMLNDYY